MIRSYAKTATPVFQSEHISGFQIFQLSHQVFAPLGAFVCTSDSAPPMPVLLVSSRFHVPRWGQRVSRGRAELSDVMGMQQGS